MTCIALTIIVDTKSTADLLDDKWKVCLNVVELKIYSHHHSQKKGVLLFFSPRYGRLTLKVWKTRSALFHDR